MTTVKDSARRFEEFVARIDGGQQSPAGAAGRPALSRAPAVVDVMGGLAEDGDALVLTAALSPWVAVAVWPLESDRLNVRLASDEADAGRELDWEWDTRGPTDGASRRGLLDRCRSESAEWAAPTCLILAEAAARGMIPADQGVAVLVYSTIPEDADLAGDSVQAAATLDALARLFSARTDRLASAQMCAEALVPLHGPRQLRLLLTALDARGDGCLTQIRFAPQFACEPLELPTGVAVVAVRTRLDRPTTPQRLAETRLCARMGHRMIAELQRRDGQARAGADDRLSAISPAEYVEHFRDRMPTRITGQEFSARYGTLRGAERDVNPRSVYKVRSRAEHIIYENKRVHEFAALMVRARRNNDAAALAKAGELMYASHWSYSQRCGIGGVETDQFVNCIKKRGAAAGLFGAKVTGGGAGGELVVLLRDDPQGRAALADAVAEAERISSRSIGVFDGSLCGADHFHRPDFQPAPRERMQTPQAAV